MCSNYSELLWLLDCNFFVFFFALFVFLEVFFFLINLDSRPSWLHWISAFVSREKSDAQRLGQLRAVVYGFHLVFCRIWHRSKAMPNKLKQNKGNKMHLRHKLCIFYIQISNTCDLKSYFTKNVIFLTESVAWLSVFPFKDCKVYI